MRAQPGHRTVAELIELMKAKMLTPNPEYQRGAVWSVTLKKKLIDSLLRGYPLPLIYLHHQRREVAGMQQDSLEVIDGQQRLNAIFHYSEGAFKLFDPKVDEQVAKFPTFLKEAPCPWAGRDIHSLDPEVRQAFLETRLPVAQIETDNPNEVRDLFVRLQSGLPLNSQETRDAWPGGFTDFILRLGGKPELPRYPGHDFFPRVMRLNPAADRGKVRQLAAQLAMLYLNRRDSSTREFCDINAAALNDFYYQNLGFDERGVGAQRLIAILDRLTHLLSGANLPKLKGHDAIHLVLLADSLWDDYTRSWEAGLPAALDRFLAHLAASGATRDTNTPDPFWLRYGQWTRVNSDRADRIAARHHFYVERMHEYLAPLQLKDPTRIYGELEKTILFYQQSKKCAECDAQVPWVDAQVHHVVEHSKGGQTTLQNGALVHSHCHPKSEAAVAAFAVKFAARKAAEAEFSALFGPG